MKFTWILFLLFQPNAFGFSNAFQSFVDNVKTNKSCELTCIVKRKKLDYLCILRVKTKSDSNLETLINEINAWETECENACN
jgi:hypothetical protein